MAQRPNTGPSSAGRSPNAPRHRVDQATTSDQDIAQPLRYEEGRLVLDVGEGLQLNSQGILEVDLSPLLGSTLEVVNGLARVTPAFQVTSFEEDALTASAGYVQQELQDVMDKFDELLDSLKKVELLDLT